MGTPSAVREPTGSRNRSRLASLARAPLGFLERRLSRLLDARVDERVDTIAHIVDQLAEARAADAGFRQSEHDHTASPSDSTFAVVAERLAALGVVVKESAVDVAGFRAYMSSTSRLVGAYECCGDVWIEKCLEHYLTARLLGLEPGQVHIDVAAAGSPLTSLLRRAGVRSFQLDCAYREGLHGRRIGADASSTGLPDGFADALTLHCSYECFMGDVDSLFIEEAIRILKPGGKLVVAPLYVDMDYFNVVSPYVDQRGVPLDEGALRVWRDDPWRVPFARHYSPESFVRRVWSKMAPMQERRVVHQTNLGTLREAHPGQRVYCHFMLVGQK